MAAAPKKRALPPELQKGSDSSSEEDSENSDSSSVDSQLVRLITLFQTLMSLFSCVCLSVCRKYRLILRQEIYKNLTFMVSGGCCSRYESARKLTELFVHTPLNTRSSH